MNKCLILSLCGLSALLCSCANPPRSIDILNAQPATYLTPMQETRKDVFTISDEIQNEMVFDASFGTRKAKALKDITESAIATHGVKTFEAVELNNIGEKADVLTDDITQLIRVYARAVNTPTFEAYLAYASDRAPLKSLEKKKTTEKMDIEDFIEVIRYGNFNTIPTIITGKIITSNDGEFIEENGESALQTVQVTKKHLTTSAMDIKKAQAFSQNVAKQADELRKHLLTTFAKKLLDRYDIVCAEYELLKDAPSSPEKSSLLVEKKTLLKEFEIVKQIVVSLEYTQTAALFIQHELSIVSQMK